jgi:putative glycosyltransferase (TIGR04348 family)
MRIEIVTPAPEGSLKGNRITAERWAGFLRDLGHRVSLTEQYTGSPPDVLVALHARRSFPSVRRYREEAPAGPLVVALTGTDVYQDLSGSSEALRSLEWADRIAALQPLAARELPERLRARVRVIYQSAAPPTAVEAPVPDAFEVCVLGHLRPVKDPFRAAEAARLLPADSRIRVLQAGAALEPEMAERARAEEAANARYRWLGELPRDQALRLLGRSRLLVLTSRLEGGANVISEAVVASVPVLCSRIPGSLGLLGEDYPGTFPVGDTVELARLLIRAETEPGYLADLQERCARRAPLFHPERERDAWRSLLVEFGHLRESGRRPRDAASAG